MPYWYMDQGDGSAIYMAAEYDTAQEADAAANVLGIYGTPVEKSVWEGGAVVQNADLEATRREKLGELRQEGDRRCGLLHPLFTDVQDEYRQVLTIKDSSYTPLGDDLADVARAWAAATIHVLALGTVQEIDAYNVQLDPGWP